MTDTWWICYGYFIRGNGRYSTSSNVTDTWWIRYGYLIAEMVDI